MSYKTSIILLSGAICYLEALKHTGILHWVAFLAGYIFVSMAILRICNRYRILIKEKKAAID